MPTTNSAAVVIRCAFDRSHAPRGYAERGTINQRCDGLLPNEMHLSGIVIAHVNPVHPGLTLGDVALQDLPDGRVVDAVPRDVFGGEELAGQGFRAELPGDFQGDGAEHDVHLADLRHAEDRIGRDDLGTYAAFFPDLAQCRLLGGFTGFHETCRQGPGAWARWNRALTQQVFAFAFDDAAGDDLRVDVVDVLTRPAHQPRMCVSIRNALHQVRAATLRTKARGGHVSVLCAVPSEPRV